METSCPIPNLAHQNVQLGHGGGGMLTHHLLKELVFPAFDNPWLQQQHDGAVITLGNRRLAFTTDSYVVQPRFFPGGDRACSRTPIPDVLTNKPSPFPRSTTLVSPVTKVTEASFAASRIEWITRASSSMEKPSSMIGSLAVYGTVNDLAMCGASPMHLSVGLTIAPSSVQTGDSILLSGDSLALLSLVSVPVALMMPVCRS